MKFLFVMTLAFTVTACGGTESSPPSEEPEASVTADVVLPEGVTCPPESLARMDERPSQADPESPDYNSAYARGWYLGYNCNVDEMPLETPPS